MSKHLGPYDEVILFMKDTFENNHRFPFQVRRPNLFDVGPTAP